MKIKSLRIKNFRGYTDSGIIKLDDLSAFVGKNDVGKSTILEALDIFFNESKGTIKLDKEDINKAQAENGNNTTEISVEFTSLPRSIVIDATNETTLEDEYLLTRDETLHVIKKIVNAGKEKVYIKANHPSNENCNDLLQKKNTELNRLLDQLELTCVDRTRNALLRKSIWQGQQNLEFQEVELDVSNNDAKMIWEKLKSYMPVYYLFQSDRKNHDGDSEIQDPMRMAVKGILNEPEIQGVLSDLAQSVRDKLDEVASRTLRKIDEINPNIANSLNPRLPDATDLKWADVFKNVSISGDNDIPVNKRGSGVKRLILLSFFRAEAERRLSDNGRSNIIYAIEEPETSQHPEHQLMLIHALQSLAQAENSQVLFTTHSPEIVKLLSYRSIRLIQTSRSGNTEIVLIENQRLPFKSLNEVNYMAFETVSEEYHNELYGYLEIEGMLEGFFSGKPIKSYTKVNSNGTTSQIDVTETQYIRHQIHHPENTHNIRYSRDQLKQSIESMRGYIQINCIHSEEPI